jgi:hypothetical protein
LAKTKPPERARTRLRQEQRLARKQVKQTARLGTMLPGGAADRPIEVTSAAVIEVRARARRCLHCDGELELRGDRATSTARGVLREVTLLCRRCHAPVCLWFRVVSGLPS